MGFTPVDEAARIRARSEFGRSFVLEAGAGTGKTTLLIDRIAALVASGRARLDEIAAVTFTENAATSMKLRLRERLEHARIDAAASPDARARAGAALEVLERAQISTIHALCAALLAERPLECGVVPGFRMADDTEADALFAGAWEDWLAERLVVGDPVLVEALDDGIPLEGFGYGERTSLRGLARTLIDQRDLRPLVAESFPDPADWRRELDAQAALGRDLAAQAQPGDTLAARLEALCAFAEAAHFLHGDALGSHLGRLAVIPKTFGDKRRWPAPAALDAARAVAAWTKQASEAWGKALAARRHARIVLALAAVAERYAARKQAAGRLDFLDLLLLARDALRRSPTLRQHFAERFRFVIIDEFQDTDPLQVEIAELLTGGRPGALVVVGDPKQSIYRFRRAEVALFARISAAATQRGDVLQLTQNFRSRPAILRFVNRVFADIIRPSAEAGQPAYEPIAPPPGLSDEPAVIALGFAAPYAQGDELLQAEALALAALLAQAAAGAYAVRDGAALRPSRAGDVLVLVRRFARLRHLEEALEAHGLRFTVDGGKSFFDRQEVHEVLAVLRAADDPTDRLALVAALRSTFFGVSDRDIASYVLAGGVLRIGAPDAERAAAPALGPALLLLEELHQQRTRLSVPALLERLYEQTRILAALTGSPRGAGRIANLEKVVALAQQAAALGVLTLRGFARTLQQRVETAREEPDLPATRPGDPDTLRILSIHRAKGLEAPIVALHDSADDFGTSAETIPLWDEGRIAVGFRRGCQPPGWDALASREEARAWAEARRLLYVAATRARDLLVVPRPPADARMGRFWKELVERLPAASDADVQCIDADTLPGPAAREAGPDLRALASAESVDAVAVRWEAERAALVALASQRALPPVSVTRLAARQAPPPVSAPGPRGGRDFGALVHRLLEWTALSDPQGVTATAHALAPAYGQDAAAAERAAAAAVRALALPVMQRAARAARLWRELPVWFAEDGVLVEGVVDLVFEEAGGLVIVDYKTDHIAPEQALAQAAHHAPQLQLYGRGLAQAAALPVRERLVLFTTLGQVVAV